MAISSNAYYNCQATGIMTDARVATWASANTVSNANYWVKVRRGLYVVSEAKLNKPQAKATLKNPNPNTTGYFVTDAYVIT